MSLAPHIRMASSAMKQTTRCIGRALAAFCLLLAPVPTPAGAAEGPAPDEAASGQAMWGFTPALFHYLKEKFVDFLNVNSHEKKSEFLIPSVINELIQNGAESVHVLKTTSSWFGVTYKSDKPIVEKKIQKLVTSGVYPSPLF